MSSGRIGVTWLVDVVGEVSLYASMERSERRLLASCCERYGGQRGMGDIRVCVSGGRDPSSSGEAGGSAGEVAEVLGEEEERL